MVVLPCAVMAHFHVLYELFPRKASVPHGAACALYTSTTLSLPPSCWSQLQNAAKAVGTCRETLSAYWQDCLQLPQINQIKSNRSKARRGETRRDPMSAICLMSCCHRWATGRQRAAEVLIISIHSIQWNAIRLNCPGAIANATAATAAVAHCTHLQSADWIDIDILHR